MLVKLNKIELPRRTLRFVGHERTGKTFAMMQAIIGQLNETQGFTVLLGTELSNTMFLEYFRGREYDKRRLLTFDIEDKNLLQNLKGVIKATNLIVITPAIKMNYALVTNGHGGMDLMAEHAWRAPTPQRVEQLFAWLDKRPHQLPFIYAEEYMPGTALGPKD